MTVFTAADRGRVQRRVLELAEADERVVAAALMGSLAHGDGDRWSDLDLMFGVEDGVPTTDVLKDWTETLIAEMAAVRLFDLPAGTTTYRVFVLPGCLQLDLSFAPASDFGALGPNFRVLFGAAVQKDYVPPAPADELFGYAVHHALRARFCIERGSYWQAEYWLSAVRDHALSLACLRRGLPESHGRGFDRLPTDVLNAFSDGLVRSLDRAELMRALGSVVAGLLREATEARELAEKAAPHLSALLQAWE